MSIHIEGTLLVALVAASLALSCVPRGSSFETAGVPVADVRPGKGAIVLGWARERREGWAIDRVRVDGTTRREWDADTQAPTVAYLEPGTRSIRLYTSQKRTGSTGAPSRRRIKLRPLAVELEPGEVRLCVVDIAGSERRRPRMHCVRYDVGDDEHPRNAHGPPAQGSPQQESASAGQECGCLDEVLGRLAAIEARIDAMSPSAPPPALVTRTRRPATEDQSVTPPPSRSQFDQSFESESPRSKRPRKSSRYQRFDESFDDAGDEGATQIKVEF